MKYIFKSKAAAKEANFRVDDTTYPWVAYRGPRFQPIESGFVPTDREARLTAFVEATIRYAGSNCDDHLANQARKALKEVDEL